MTNTEIIQAIRNEIERLKGQLIRGACAAQIEMETNCKEKAYDEVLSFLSTLESETTISPWKKIHTYTEELHEGDMEKMLLELSVGKGEKRTKTALPDRIVDILESEKPVPNDLEEAAEKHSTDYDSTIWYVLESPNQKTIWKRELKETFIAGAKWQDANTPLPEDTVLFNKGVAEGKRLMMGEAVEAEVVSRITGQGLLPAVTFLVDSSYKEGDKVRVIVIPNTDEK